MTLVQRPAKSFRSRAAAPFRHPTWPQRDRVRAGLRDRRFLPPARSIIETPLSPVRRDLAMVICAIFAIAVVMGTFGRLDIYAEADGRTEPVGRSKVIQPLDAGRVLRVAVHNGSRVAAGQLLMELDPTVPVADEQTATHKAVDLEAEVARRTEAIRAATAGAFDRPSSPRFAPDVPSEVQASEVAVLKADLSELGATVSASRAKIDENLAAVASARATIAAHDKVIQSLKQRVELRQQLLSGGWDTRTNYIDAAEDLGKEEASYATAVGQLTQAQAQIATLKREIREAVTKFTDENSQAANDARAKLDEGAQDLVKARASVGHTRLLSPIDGTVQQLEITTIGQVVAPGQQLMTVVPARAPLEIEALISNKDIGFVRVGQPVVVKVAAFPFSRYGTMKGRVVRISRDAVSAQEAAPDGDTRLSTPQAQSSAAAPVPKMQALVYPIAIQLEQTTIRADGRLVTLTPGMNVTVEVRTGRRRAISYLLSPLAEVFSDAGHER